MKIMATEQERRIAAVVGSLVADAAAVPLHWVYKTDKLDSIVEGAEDVGFWETSQCPFYKISCGSLSGYADQAYVVLKSLVKNKGLDSEALKEDTLEWFGPKSEYEKNSRNAVHKKPDEPPQELPITGPWRHGSIKHMMQNVEEGKQITGSETDSSMDCCVRVVPVVALYAGCDDMLTKAECVIRQTQNNDKAVAGGLAGARLLEYYILNGSKDDAVDHVIKELSNENRRCPQELDGEVVAWLKDVVEKRNEDHIAAARKYRLSCSLPDALQSAAHAIITNKDYLSGVQANVKVGGDNCSRSGFIGACLAAQYGLSSIPEPWKQKTLRFQEILQLTQQLVAGTK